MSITYSITPEGGSSANFVAIATASGRYAMSIKSSNNHYDIKRFHPPGVDGQYLVRCGRLGRTIMARARYVGKIAAVLGNIKTDSDAWANVPCTIIDDAGNSYANCNLLEYNRTTDPTYFRMNSTDPFVFVDCQFSFTWDGG